MTIALSLIIPYRQREPHLKTLLNWVQWHHEKIQKNAIEILLVELTSQPSPEIQKTLDSLNLTYYHLPCEGIFHKTKALNFGLQQARGQFITPYDVDLIPRDDTLFHHLKIAQQSLHLLITGYRLMLEVEQLDEFPTDVSSLSPQIAPEDQKTALWKQLVDGERFGVLPFFSRHRLLEMGGWDENFVGWGGEDQDLIERYLGKDQYLCRIPELVYFHLFHSDQEQWKDSNYTEKNRDYYYQKRKDFKSS